MSKLIHYSGPAGSYLLPNGYTRLFWIQSTGDQWVDSGLKVDSTDNTIHISMEYEFTELTAWATILGSHGNNLLFRRSNTNNYMEYYLNSGSPLSNTPLSINTRYHTYVKINSSSGYVNTNGQELSGTVSRLETNTSHPANFILFGSRTGIGEGTMSMSAKAKLYDFSITIDNRATRHMVPVQTTAQVTNAYGTDSPSGTVGLLDLVENKFYPSKFGSFIAGPEIPQGFPTNEYCQVEWLEGDGNAYINTTYTIKSNTEIQSTWDHIAAGNIQQIYAANDNNTWDISLWDTSGYYCRFLQCTPSSTLYWDAAGKHTYIHNSTGLKMDGTQKITYNTTGTSTNAPLCLFGSPNTSYARGIVRLERMTIKEGSTVVRDYIPCYRRSDMQPGVYDIVERFFYTNTVGKLSIGPSITSGWGEVVNGAGEPVTLSSNWRNPSAYAKEGTHTITSYSSGVQITGSSFSGRVYLSTSNVWVENGGKYTVSCLARSTADGKKLRFSRSIADYAPDITLSTEWQQVQSTITLTATSTSGTLSIQTDGTVQILDLQLEKGSKARRFLPAIPHNISSVGKLTSPYDSNIYSEPDGSQWIRIFHHNNPKSQKLFESTDNILNCYKDEDRWSYFEAFDKLSNYEIMIKQKGTSDGVEQKYRFIQNSNPNTTTSNTGVTYNIASEYNTSSYGAIRKYSGNAFYCCSSNAWWGAFGVMTNWSSYRIPGWNSTYISTGYVDLYVRIPADGKECFEFNGIDSYFILKDPIPQSTTQFSISFWYYPKTSDTGALWNGRTSVGNSVAVFDASSAIYFHTGNSESYRLASGAVSRNAWHHVVCTWKSGGKSTIYIDGVLSKQGNAGTLTKSNIYATIGISSVGNTITTGSSSNAFNGYLRDYQVFDNELLLEDVQKLYSNGQII